MPKFAPIAAAVGAWMIAAALSILSGPWWLGVAFFVLGIGLMLTAFLWWVIETPAETPSQGFSRQIRREGKAVLKQRRERAKEISHREGCSANPDRTETFMQTRPDGIEVETTRCLDCGRAIYRHGDTPTKEPVEPPLPKDPRIEAVEKSARSHLFQKLALEAAKERASVERATPQPLSGAEREELRALIHDGEGLCVHDMDEKAVTAWFMRSAHWLEQHRNERVARRFDRDAFRSRVLGGSDELREFVSARLVDLRVVLTNNMLQGFAPDLTPMEALERWFDVQDTPQEQRQALRNLTAELSREIQDEA